MNEEIATMRSSCNLPDGTAELRQWAAGICQKCKSGPCETCHVGKSLGLVQRIELAVEDDDNRNTRNGYYDFERRAKRWIALKLLRILERRSEQAGQLGVFGLWVKTQATDLLQSTLAGSDATQHVTLA